MISEANKSGQSMIEFSVLALCVIVAAVVAFPFIRDYMSSEWHTVGQSISFGMAYQEGGSSCTYDSQYGIWYKSDCFETNDCDKACFSSVPPPAPGGGDPCQYCLSNCTGDC